MLTYAIDVLSQNLCLPLNQIKVIVMLDPGEKEILALLEFISILNDTHFFIVTQKKDYSSFLPVVLQLNPGFIGNPYGFEDILSVLKKVVMRLQKRNSIPGDCNP